MKSPMVVPWVNGSRLVVEKGMAGATGNVYCGLHEFNDMGFVLHFIRPEELFLDIGANVGTYTILAAGAVGAKVVSFEPILGTYRRLMDNININALLPLVEAHNIGLGSEVGMLAFSQELDAENHVLSDSERSIVDSVQVPVSLLDDVLAGRGPTMVKIDVEGFETEVIRGGKRAFNSPSLEAVLIELNGAGSRYGFSEEKIRNGFAERGFTPCYYDPLLRCLKVITVKDAELSGNTLYVKDVRRAQVKLLQAPQFCVLGRSM
jgi:FkbM family methyltransferase